MAPTSVRRPGSRRNRGRPAVGPTPPSRQPLPTGLDAVGPASRRRRRTPRPPETDAGCPRPDDQPSGTSRCSAVGLPVEPSVPSVDVPATRAHSYRAARCRRARSASRSVDRVEALTWLSVWHSLAQCGRRPCSSGRLAGGGARSSSARSRSRRLAAAAGWRARRRAPARARRWCAGQRCWCRRLMPHLASAIPELERSGDGPSAIRSSQAWSGSVRSTASRSQARGLGAAAASVRSRSRSSLGRSRRGLVVQHDLGRAGSGSRRRPPR